MRDILRAELIERGFNQAAIARKVYLTPAKLSATLHKSRRLEAHELLRLCGALGIDLNVLMQTVAGQDHEPQTTAATAAGGV